MFSKLSSIAFALTLALGVTVAQDFIHCTRTYKVQYGDTCDSIANSQKVSNYQLSLFTGLPDNCRNPPVGKEICLGIPGQDCTNVHRVGKGETCGTISGKYDISIDVLLMNNLNVDPDCSSIRTGEVLCVSPDEIPYDHRDD